MSNRNNANLQSFVRSAQNRMQSFENFPRIFSFFFQNALAGTWFDFLRFWSYTRVVELIMVGVGSCKHFAILYHEAQGELFGKLLEEDFWLCIRLLIVCFVRVFILERLQNWMHESIHFLFFYKAFLKAPVMIPSSKQRLSLDK